MTAPLINRPPSPETAEIAQAEAAAGLRAAFRLFDLWELTAEQARTLLGQPSPATFYRWKAGKVGQIPHDCAWRIGDLLGIHKALRYLFADPARGHEWIRKPNLAFGGRSALDRMLAGAPSDIAAVRAYLDAERSGW
jgi:Protein of unknown function (DUF2384)